MIDPMVSLAFAVYSNKGTYALLLGSGISRAAGIPTGWEVVLDLIRKVAKLEGEDCEPDPADWFRKKHGSEPDYSKLLDAIAKTPAERQQLLRGYFEPNEEDRRQGLKLPSSAHKAIAQLVATGYLRVIITTNFDRLMEKALEDVGVAPTVISTTDQLSGALPLAHSGTTIIKLHGDYLDTRIRNTDLELASYDKALDSMLDRIFDEYGLIVSGWSGDWDVALRAALERCPSRRFTMFWGARSELSDGASKLAKHRKALIVRAKDADQLFTALLEKVQSLQDLESPHPLSSKMAIAALKRYLVTPASRIVLRDLVHAETEKLYAVICSSAYGGKTSVQPEVEIVHRVAQYEAQTNILLGLIVTGSYWGDESTHKLWVNVLQRVANLPAINDGYTTLIQLRRYPALLLFYGAGLGAVAAGKYQTLASLFLTAKIRDAGNQVQAICLEIHPGEIMEKNVGQLLPGMKDKRTPVSNYLFIKLRDPLLEYLPDDHDYLVAFDRFEYLLALCYADLSRQECVTEGWFGPFGCFLWRNGRFSSGDAISKIIESEISADGADWPPLKAGLWGGSLSRLKDAKAHFDTFLRSISIW